jgi:hypothetical protein
MHPDLLHGLARAEARRHLDLAAGRRLAALARAHQTRRPRFAWRSLAFTRRKVERPARRDLVTAFSAPRYVARQVSRN